MKTKKHFVSTLWTTFKTRTKKTYFYPILATAVLAVLFLVITIFFLQASNTSNVFLGYYKSLLIFIEDKWRIVVTVIFLVFLYFLKVIKHNLKGNKKKKVRWLIITGRNLIVYLILSTILAFSMSFLVGIIQMNLVALEVKSNASKVGIIWGKEAIVSNLKQRENSPVIIETNHKDINQAIIANKIDSYQLGSLYKQKILPISARFLLIKLKIPKENLVILNDTLYVTELNGDDLQAISPILGYLMVNNYFSPRLIKKDPEIAVLGRQDYLKFRDDQINSQLQYLDGLVLEINNEINTIYSSISNDKNKISANQSALANSITYKNNDYTNCMSYSYYDYFTGLYTRLHNDSYCQASASLDWDDYIATLQKNISDWQSQLNYDQTQLGPYLEAKKFLASYRILIASQKDSAPAELGIFQNSTGKITIALDWSNSKSIYYFIETLSHEYLHFSSYISTERQLDLTFEEGLTEYYARQVIKKTTGKEIKLGYPLLVKIIDQMVKDLPSDELQNIYFTKDTAGLTALLDSKYGKNFYEDNLLKLAVLPYSSEKEAIGIANEIMKKIGGDKIIKEDLESDYFSHK